MFIGTIFIVLISLIAAVAAIAVVGPFGFFIGIGVLVVLLEAREKRYLS